MMQIYSFQTASSVFSITLFFLAGAGCWAGKAYPLVGWQHNPLGNVGGNNQHFRVAFLSWSPGSRWRDAPYIYLYPSLPLSLLLRISLLNRLHYGASRGRVSLRVVSIAFEGSMCRYPVRMRKLSDVFFLGGRAAIPAHTAAQDLRG